MPLALVTFLVTVAYVPGLPSNAVVGRWAVVMLGGAYLLWGVRLRPTPGHWMFAALLVWVVLGFSWAVSLWDHAGGLVQWAALAFVFCVGAEQRDLRPMWLGLALGVTVSAVFSVLQVTDWGPVWRLYSGGSPGLFLSKNMAAEVFVLALIGALGYQLWWLVPGPLVSLALLNSRAGVVALAASGLYVLWLKNRQAMWMLSWVAAFVLVTAWGVKPELFRLEDRLTIWGDIAPHLNLWGDGLGSVAVAFPFYEYAHNEPLHFAFELGLGSLLIWGIGAYAFGNSHATEKAALVALGVLSLVWFPLHAPTVGFVGTCVAGFLSGSRYRARVPQPAGRAARSGGPGYRPELLSIGAPVAADVSRFGLPAGPQPALVAGELRYPL